MDSILAAAGRALGRRLREPVDLGGSARTSVLRCRTSDGNTVVVKAYLDPTDGPARFVAEASGLVFGAGVGPELLAVDRDVPLIVMADLGTAPSLADLLLGDSPTDARSALLAWARGCGRLAARSIGREPELATIRARYQTTSEATNGTEADAGAWVAEVLANVPAAFAALGGAADGGLGRDLAEVGVLADLTRWAGFSPADICPDNNVITEDGLRLLDFEFAGFRPVFLDAAYARMPFSSCWCVFRLPDGLGDKIESAYRAELVSGCPELADDALWRPMVLRAMALWTLHLTTVLGARAAEADRPTHRTRRPVPSMRQLLRYRWAELADQLDAAGELSALATGLRGLLAATRCWRVGELGRYPAFGGVGAG